MAVHPTTSGVDEISLKDFNKSTLLTGTSASEPTGVTAFGYPITHRYEANETIDVNGKTPQRAKTTLAQDRKAATGALDKSLLERAKSIIDGFNCDDIMDATINLESLRGIVLQLWESATSGTQFHQAILAILESALISVESPNEGQLSVFREAISDLENDVLTQAHIDVIQRRFIGEGFSPLALLSEIEEGDDSN